MVQHQRYLKVFSKTLMSNKSFVHYTSTLIPRTSFVIVIRQRSSGTHLPALVTDEAEGSYVEQSIALNIGSFDWIEHYKSELCTKHYDTVLR